MSSLSDFTFFPALLGDGVRHCLKVFNSGRGLLVAQPGVYYGIISLLCLGLEAEEHREGSSLLLWLAQEMP